MCQTMTLEKGCYLKVEKYNSEKYSLFLSCTKSDIQFYLLSPTQDFLPPQPICTLFLIRDVVLYSLELRSVAINKTMQLRTNSLFIQNFLQRRSQSLSLVSQGLKGRHRIGKFCSEKRGRLQICPDWRLLPKESRGGITRSEGSYVSDLRSMFGFL